MKALSIRNIGRLECIEIPVPTFGEDELLIRAGACVICTSDIKDLWENPFHIPLPVTPGHEAAGTVVSTGSRVTQYKAGDRVAVHPVHPCGNCSSCRQGLGHLCKDMRHLGLNMQGAFAEYFVAREDRVRLAPSGADFAVSALLEPVCVCLEALNQSHAGKGKKLAILGDGPFGLMMSRLASLREPEAVVLAGHHDFRLNLARTAKTLNTHQCGNPIDELMQLSSGSGYDAVIVTIGSAQAVQMGLELLKPKGRLVLFAPIVGGSPLDLTRAVFQELEIVGANNDHNLMDIALELLVHPQLRLDELITHRFPLDKYSDAFALAKSSKDQAVKVAIVFET